MRPQPRSTMPSITCLVTLNTLLRLVLITAIQSCSVIFLNTVSRVMPALLTRMSIGPTLRRARCRTSRRRNRSRRRRPRRRARVKPSLRIASSHSSFLLVARQAARDHRVARLRPRRRQIARADAAHAAGDERDARVPSAASVAPGLPVRLPSVRLLIIVLSSVRRPAPRPCRRRCTARRGPRFASRFCISCSSVTRMRQPEAPIGWPSAIAPPLTLTLFVSQPISWLTAQACAANASLISIRSRSFGFQPARARQRLRRRHRAHAHVRRIDARPRRSLDARERLQAELLRLLRRHHDHRGGAVVDAGGIAGGHRAVLVERGLQACQRLERRAVARELVVVEDDRVAFALTGSRPARSRP